MCYGDSNTFGFNPKENNRFKHDERWSGILDKKMGSNYYIIEEGLNHRTTIWDDPILEYKNGKTYLIPCLHSHKPIDLVILMLGANDLKSIYNLRANAIGDSVGVLAELILKSGAGIDGNPPELLILCPPKLGKLTRYAEMFEGYKEKEEKLPYYYEEVATDVRCHFFDVSEHIQCPNTDGLHLEAPQHKQMGNLIADVVKNIFERRTDKKQEKNEYA